MLIAFIISLATLLASALVPLLIYAATSAGADFSIRSFVIKSRSRLIYGFIAMTIVAALLTFVDGVAAAIVAVGFAPHGSAAGVGLALGGLLVASVRGNKT